MVAFSPEELPLKSTPAFEEELNGNGKDSTVLKTDLAWVPMWRHGCTFGPEIFADKMMNLIRNPNLNSSWLFRADILYDDGSNDGATSTTPASSPIPCNIKSMSCQRTLVRKMIPRNERRDEPLAQTCSFYQSPPSDTSSLSTLVLYIPHASTPAEIPFYHPIVRGIAHLHIWDTVTETGTVSVHFLPYPDHPLQDQKLRRTAYHLLQIIHKHGHSSAAGYVKRVNHDVIISQPRFQNRYALLKSKYARSLVESWVETTDPEKHVFEDLGIAAFLLELWNDMYAETPFPGFVDIGCGNGLLVYILIREGYAGWGFDARRRRSWQTYSLPSSNSPSGSSLEERLLLPTVVPNDSTDTNLVQVAPTDLHDGIFPAGTFIISNHADELTPWTPILATISQCPFIMIPCCSHNLTGEKYRAPPPRDKTKSRSTFASLVDWVTRIAEDCGWDVETEMLRIPSTRNTGLLGRKRITDAAQVDVQAVLTKYGGVGGYFANVVKLVMKAPGSH